MLSTDDFKAFGKDFVLFLHVTSTVEGEKYGTLLKEKGGNGFPYVVAMDADGNVIAELEDRSVDGFRAMMKAGGEFVALKAKKDRTPAEELRVLVAEVKTGAIPFEEFKAKAGALQGLDAAGIKERDGILVAREIRSVLEKINAPGPALRIAAGKAFAAMLKEGRVPTAENDIGAYYQLLLEYAESEKDAALFEKGLVVLKQTFSSNPRAKDFLAQLDEKLAKLKAGEGKKDEGGKKEEGGAK